MTDANETGKTELHRFHLAFPVTDLEAARRFYRDVLGCTPGREAPDWIDFDFFGHQISAHWVSATDAAGSNPVDGHHVPSRHFGVVLSMAEWQKLVEQLEAQGVTFVIEPNTRFQGQAGEQATFFIEDPSANVLEFKAFRSADQVFAR